MRGIRTPRLLFESDLPPSIFEVLQHFGQYFPFFGIAERLLLVRGQPTSDRCGRNHSAKWSCSQQFRKDGHAMIALNEHHLIPAESPHAGLIRVAPKWIPHR